MVRVVGLNHIGLQDLLMLAMQEALESDMDPSNFANYVASVTGTENDFYENKKNGFNYDPPQMDPMTPLDGMHGPLGSAIAKKSTLMAKFGGRQTSGMPSPGTAFTEASRGLEQRLDQEDDSEPLHWGEPRLQSYQQNTPHATSDTLVVEETHEQPSQEALEKPGQVMLQQLTSRAIVTYREVHSRVPAMDPDQMYADPRQAFVDDTLDFDDGPVPERTFGQKVRQKLTSKWGIGGILAFVLLPGPTWLIGGGLGAYSCSGDSEPVVETTEEHAPNYTDIDFLPQGTFITKRAAKTDLEETARSIEALTLAQNDNTPSYCGFNDDNTFGACIYNSETGDATTATFVVVEEDKNIVIYTKQLGQALSTNGSVLVTDDQNALYQSEAGLTYLTKSDMPSVGREITLPIHVETLQTSGVHQKTSVDGKTKAITRCATVYDITSKDPAQELCITPPTAEGFSLHSYSAGLDTVDFTISESGFLGSSTKYSCGYDKASGCDKTVLD